MVKDQTEKGLYEYTDSKGYARIGQWVKRYRYRRGKKVGVVDFYDDEDEDEYSGAGPGRRECPNCLKYDLHSPLRAKRVEYGQPVPPDNDKFIECYQCNTVYAKHEIERQKKLRADTKQHKSDNPFELGETIIESVPSRTSPTGKKAMEKRGYEKNRAHHHDKEIDDAIRRFGDENVHVVHDSMEEGSTR